MRFIMVYGRYIEPSYLVKQNQFITGGAPPCRTVGGGKFGKIVPSTISESALLRLKYPEISFSVLFSRRVAFFHHNFP
jgi:hypothetical protein